jgi:nuclear transport factor 2 (NTF2) superfamily protein
MTSPLDEAVERVRQRLKLRDADALLITLRVADLRTILNALSPDEERVARAIAYEFDVDADMFIGMHGREKWEKQWHPIARAAIQSIVGERDD